MDLTIELSIVGGVVWFVAIIVEYVWYWRQDHIQGTDENEGEPFEPPNPSDESAMTQKVG